MTTHPLDNPIWHSLTGGHAHLAIGAGRVRRYPAAVSRFVGLSDAADPTVWAELAGLVVPDQLVAVAADPMRVPANWLSAMSLAGVQMVASSTVKTTPDPSAMRLGPADVDDMLELVRVTEPGPFGPETYRMGTYLGIRCDGVLVAMAGERLHPVGWTEVSGVCTLPAYSGRGLASRLVRALCAGILARGERPFLHVLSNNTGAIALYERLGFAVRRPIMFELVARAENARLMPAP